ncbi:N-acetylmuramoyl-L-alanine amidase [Streptomyces antibioticus]|uniref:N-acetylmuramoyl-L-alanine amidase n=1 Tax=Streptomyces antibioticus TaxID=1890 RepID=A0AAE6Y758_STRAT|nr:N-acetylmuramoyl-L-alanine amidase [Streptomyces antibioticus]MCX5168722.1 N-acetylmuramoyl-L-alanine amidase [Streptomyces antibioticus]OOQ53211.1 N-acetylmuramoyl-L-alanine amidase [Streptomyces antibioticus]QIT44245.1 N-acetylmuramoyl-L-alanine amidase [Streptomyces antibioticus]
MSYTGPPLDPFDPFGAPQPRRSPLRRGLTVALAVLVPGALVGWLAYATFGPDGEGDGSGSAGAATGTASAPRWPNVGNGKSGLAAPSGSTDAAPSDSASSGAGSSGEGSLAGKVVVIDPGHNPTNVEHTAEINRTVDIGTHSKECDTTGTSTNSGYSEARFTLDVAHRLRTLLQQQGATVKLTQDADRPYGPCVDERARIGNAAHADAVVSIHADGSGAGNRGFHVILPGSVRAGAADTRAIVGPSKDLGKLIAADFAAATGTSPSNYIGGGTGLVTREDLGGLNLSTVPKVFIECGNMRDSKDAALLTSGAWRQKAAQGISEGIVSFLRG